MRRRVRVAAMAVAVTVIAACELDIISGGIEPGTCGGSARRYCIGFALTSVGGGLLKGETLRVVTLSDSGFGAPVTWSISGAGALVPGSERDTTVLEGAAGKSILIRGTAVGKANLSATHASGRSVSLPVDVADSSVITQILLSASSFAVGSRDSLVIRAQLMSAQLTYDGRPESWSTSDPTRGTVAVSADGRAWLRGHAAGQVDVIASFKSARGTLRITVTP